MLAIRLSRVGKKNYATYRLIISEKHRDPYGKALEILGSYNPHTKELKVEAERINHWISKGAQMSPTVNNLLITKEIIKGEKMKASKRGKKALEAEKAAKLAALQPKPKEEAPAAEAPETAEAAPAETAAEPAEAVEEKKEEAAAE